MTSELWIACGIPVATSLYAVYRAGQTNDDRTKGLIKTEIENSDKVKAAEKATSDLQFSHMVADISRMNDSITEILRMIRESIATKQDMAHIEFRLDALEASSAEHYRNGNELKTDVAGMKQRCASHHRTGDTSAISR